LSFLSCTPQGSAALAPITLDNACVSPVPKVQQLLAALDERHDLVDPSEAELRDYDARTRTCVGFATEDRTISLSIARTQDANAYNWPGEVRVTYSAADAPRRLIGRDCFPVSALPNFEGGL
jgi:hypothetical protein